MANRTPTADQIRDDIDKGKTGEKIDFPDPAAAPLVTDAEAGGTPPSKQERRVAAIAPASHTKGMDIGLWLYGLMAGLASLAILSVVFVTG